MRLFRKVVAVLSTFACDMHAAQQLRYVTPRNGDSSDTHLLVRRLDETDHAHTCGVCGEPATWYFETMGVFR